MITSRLPFRGAALLCGVIVSGIMLLLTGCRQKELVMPCGEASEVDVEFVWTRAPGANPAGMTVCFFPRSEGGRIWRFDIAGRRGGKVELPPGRYMLAAVNNDLPGVNYSVANGSVTVGSRSAGSEGIVMPSGMVYGATVAEVEVSACGREVVRCEPDSMSTVYNICVTDLRNPSAVRSATAMLSGCASSLDVVTAVRSGREVATVASLSPAANGDAMLAGLTSGLGSPSMGRVAFELTVTLTRSDNKTFVKTFNVTEQVVNSTSPRNVYICVSGAEFPDSDSGEGSDVDLSVGVDGWQEIVIDITTGL